jgi:hypothetical protein
MKKSYAIVAAVLMLFSGASAQRAEVAITLNEAFFNTFIDSVFTNFDPPEFPLASIRPQNPDAYATFQKAAFGPSRQVNGPCAESIKILRETGGVRTAARIRDGRINVPLAFSGTYSPPFVGCVEFAGWVDSNIDLVFDRDSQRLVGRATVASVNLNGAGGIGSTLIARMIQNSLDRKMNPIDILRLDKLSFVLPIQNTGSLRLKADAIRPEITPGAITLHIEYEFLKG